MEWRVEGSCTAFRIHRDETMIRGVVLSHLDKTLEELETHIERLFLGTTVVFISSPSLFAT